MPRYVVLEHTTPEGYRGQTAGVHWDLMLEHNGLLLTWSLAEPPSPNRSIVAQRLPDHRLPYLDYQGDLTGDRGAVQRVAAGEFTWLHYDPNQMVIELGSSSGLQRCTLDYLPDGSWTATFSCPLSPKK